jgi:hypothetical protein
VCVCVCVCVCAPQCTTGPAQQPASKGISRMHGSRVADSPKPPNCPPPRCSRQAERHPGRRARRGRESDGPTEPHILKLPQGTNQARLSHVCRTHSCMKCRMTTTPNHKPPHTALFYRTPSRRVKAHTHAADMIANVLAGTTSDVA